MADNKDEKVYFPETIPDTPFPAKEEEDLGASQASSQQIYKPAEILDQPLPKKVIAHETIGAALNTKSRKILAEFQFAQYGSIQIGKYESGVSGDVRITPNGITARDSTGATTFSLDGETGDAVFKGEVQAGSIITGLVTVGDENVVIDGENKRIIINDGTDDRILIGFDEDGF